MLLESKRIINKAQIEKQQHKTKNLHNSHIKVRNKTNQKTNKINHSFKDQNLGNQESTRK
jgi:hypothetical protein